MYSAIKIIMVSLCILSFEHAFAQSERSNNNSIETGIHVAGDETLFYGANSKFIMPLSQKKHYPTLAHSLTISLDRKGESESRAYLKKAVDMRIMPALHLGYSLNFKNLQLNFEVPVGTSIAITKGTLINERVGFERDYSNTELFWHYGLAFSPKYRLNKANQIGLYGFLPLVPDKTSSGYLYGIGWTKSLIKK
jgi:hypothetical protein